MTEPTVAADSAVARANAERVLDFFASVLGPNHQAGLAEYLHPDFVDHDPSGTDAGAAGVADKLAALWLALPDGWYRPVQVVAAGDLVVVRSRLEASAATPPVSVPFADTYRLVDGRLIEHWHVVDAGELGRQLAARAGT